MLLLSVLFDHGLTVQERAEMFLELHGNVLLRQKTADYLGGWLQLMFSDCQVQEVLLASSVCSACVHGTQATSST